ncbi:MAG: glycosyltransferase family 2 protein [Synergistaceae bacterium]|nr:glycosyltransferase family 2 protein [Synergistaceae bacterium]
MITLPEIIERDKRPPSVTVYMLCYNHEKYIDQAIKSVLMQKTNFPVNILIHDDASPDSSAEIIRRYASENPNITAIIEESNCILHGKTFFQNMIQYFTGKYIAYCECDDYWIDENKLQIQVDYLENNPDCIGVYSNWKTINRLNEEIKHIMYNEGDYPRNYIMGVRHQLATCVHRNFWRFMTSDEINFYVSLRGNVGDQQLIAILVHLGRVHYFSQIFTTYRFIRDEGDSYSARMARLPKFELEADHILWRSEIYRMLEHYFGKKHYYKYLFVLYWELRARVKSHRSIINEAHLNPCYHLKNIPCFIYAAFPFYAAYRVAKKIFRVIIGKK